MDVGMWDNPGTYGGWDCNSRSRREARLQRSLPEALAGCGSFIYSLLLFILCLVFAEGCSSRTRSLGPAMPWEQGPAWRWARWTLSCSVPLCSPFVSKSTLLFLPLNPRPCYCCWLQPLLSFKFYRAEALPPSCNSLASKTTQVAASSESVFQVSFASF